MTRRSATFLDTGRERLEPRHARDSILTGASRLARQAGALLLSLVLILAGGVVMPVWAQTDPGAEAGEQTEAQAIVQYVQQVLAGTAPPPAAPLSWRPSFVKSGDQVYVPFTVLLPPGEISGPQVAMYYAVTPKGPQVVAVAVAPDEADGAKVTVQGQVINTSDRTLGTVRIAVTAMDDAGKVLASEPATVSGLGPNQTTVFKVSMEPPRNVTQYNATVEGMAPGFREFAVVDLPTAPAGEPVRLSRAFVVPAGDYDVYLALRERGTPAPGTPAVALLRESVQIPDLNSALALSSVLVAERVDQLSAPLSQEQQMARPFTFGPMAITPVTSMELEKDGEMSFIFFVYNAGSDGNNKPNVAAEFGFYRRAGQGEEFFNNTEPQTFNASTLPAGFDLRAGHQIVAGQTIPLSAFEAGDYRLEISVRDEISGQSVQSDVLFSVTE